MQIVTRKSDIKLYLEPCIQAYHNLGIDRCVKEVNHQILSKKVKFPLLEFCAHMLYKEISLDQQLLFCDKIEALKTEGGNVLLGILLQNRLALNFEESLKKATGYIANAHIWYICDIIGERVYGFSLLHQPDKTLAYLQKTSNHPQNWVIRAMGAGIHYAIKKGVGKNTVRKTFLILLSKASDTDKEIRQGIGWAAKTTARYHPDIIESFQEEIHNTTTTANWFRKKIDIGLQRNQYASRN